VREQFFEREEIIDRGGLFGGEEIVEREEYIRRDGFEREEVIERPGLLGSLLGEPEIVREEVVERDFF
jgi:hypothetical protein